MAAIDARRALCRDGKWHPWFAWHPVRTPGAWAWMSWVMRRGLLCFDGEAEWVRTEYKEAL